MYMPNLSTKTPPLPQAPHSAPGSRMPSAEPTGPVCSYNIQTRILVIYPKHAVNFHKIVQIIMQIPYCAFKKTQKNMRR